MDKFFHSRLFRCLLCLVLVCCILVNISPLKAESTEIAAASVPFFGMVLWYMFMSSGVVFEPTNDVLNQLDKQGQVVIGEALDKLDEAQALAAEDEFRKSVVDRMYFSDDFDFPEDDYDDGYQDDEVPDWGIKSGENHNLILGASLGAVLAEWVYDAIMDNQVKVEEEVPAPEGYVYCGDVLIPPLPSIDSDKLPYVYAWQLPTNIFECYAFSEPIFGVSVGTSSTTFRAKSNSDYSWYRFNPTTDTDWAFIQSGKIPFSGTEFSVASFVYSNNSLSDSSGNQLSIPSEIASTKTTTVPLPPDTYFGEIPDQVKAGNYDSSNIQFPDYNISDSIVSEQAAQQQMQDIYNQVVNNQMSYEDFMQQVQAVPPVGPVDPTPTPSEPGETTPDETQPEEDEDDEALSKFSLDLSDYFPFCIPFDLYDFFACLAASPEAPVIHWEIVGPGGSSHELNLDLSPYDSVAQLLRRLQLLLFCVGLAFKTRDLIKG